MVDYEPSESQRIIMHEARRFFSQEASDFAREIGKTDQVHSPGLWRKMAALGWMGLPFPEVYGGHEGSILDLVFLVEEMGMALVPGPFIPTLVCGLAILEFGTEEQKRDFLPAIAAGERIVAPALSRMTSGSGIRSVREQRHPGQYHLTGTRRFVPYGHIADGFLCEGETEEGETIFLVDGREKGIHRRLMRTLAGDGQSEITFENVPVNASHLLGKQGEGSKIGEQIGQYGALFESAFILGLLEKVLSMAVHHAKQREQFGKLIGSFQIIQHQCADMATEVDRLKFLTYHAAWKVSEKISAAYEIATAKARASDAAHNVCMLGIKIHGGIGITEEFDLQLYFRLAKSAELSFGDGDFHREILARHLGLWDELNLTR
jgi:alkylation response protein AidB-like acyl-CoA dehydrogenase